MQLRRKADDKVEGASCFCLALLATLPLVLLNDPLHQVITGRGARGLFQRYRRRFTSGVDRHLIGWRALGVGRANLGELHELGRPLEDQLWDLNRLGPTGIGFMGRSSVLAAHWSPIL